MNDGTSLASKYTVFFEDPEFTVFGKVMIDDERGASDDGAQLVDGTVVVNVAEHSPRHNVPNRTKTALLPTVREMACKVLVFPEIVSCIQERTTNVLPLA